MGRVECNAKEPRHAVIVSEDERMALDICALSSNSMSDWLDCLESAGALISGTRNPKSETRNRLV